MNRIILLNEMMYMRGGSYKIRYDLASSFSNNMEVIMISPSYDPIFKIKKILHSDSFTEYVTSGFLTSKFRRGGFGIIDLLFKVYIILKNKPDLVYVTTGHRPSQLIPALISKFLFGSTIIDERWEYYGKDGRALDRKGFIGFFIKYYDLITEKRLINFYDYCICISKYLLIKLQSKNTIFLPGVIDYSNHVFYDKHKIRKVLEIDIETKLFCILGIAEIEYIDYKPFFSEIINLIKRGENISIFVTGEKNFINGKLNDIFGDNLIYKGWLSNDKLYQYLSATDVFLLPLENSPKNLGRWPIKFNDFIFFKKPIITFRDHDISDFFGEKEYIITYSNIDSDEIKFVMKKAISLIDSNESDIGENEIKQLNIDSRIKSIMNLLKN